MSRYIRLQDLVGRRVRNAAGKVVGRIEAVHAVCSDDGCLLEEFELGTGALLARFGIVPSQPRRVSWQDLDLSDPGNPRLRS